MNDNIKDRKAIYEIGYLIAGSIAEENIPAEAEKVKKVIIDAGAEVIAGEVPKHQHLAYTIRRKTVSGSYDKYDEAYFGWVKFELGTDKIEALKKTVEIMPAILRMIVITTVRENTYLGKDAPTAPAVAVPTLEERNVVRESRKTTADVTAPEGVETVTPATPEEMDKSIEDMVKEA